MPIESSTAYAEKLECARNGLGPGTAEDHTDGPSHDLQIEPQAPIVDVGGVERNVLIERRVSAGLHLPQASDSGENFKAAQMPQFV